MKELLLQYAGYNLWANQLMADAINLLPEEKQTQEITSSFNSLFKTIMHLWDAESIWWQRIKLQERIVIQSQEYKGNTKDALTSLLQMDKQWLEWITNSQEHALQHVFQYQNSKREQFKQPVFQVLVQVFNHGTYHRGQMVTMLRQLGIDKIPGTDFITWSRKK